MPEFDQIDLMNYAVYGNEHDPEWLEIRNYIQSNSTAQKEYEEIKRNLPALPARRRTREFGRSQTSNSPSNTATAGSRTPEGNPTSDEARKKWWNVFLGE
ncbi:hypothetical protein CH373_00310 [Leptospira perolatii]|uniref:Uncharacterized protein n=1 Tax=Leptospira perolatii TaxID=2023191 RepID=A0A2M9ZR84_9LEPT|nr:hypothetical protein [Leptospira perolatii]PJZ71012.1 hypothetical protein CH360_00310 [Leptospira perolatii]PJZ74544.1 hypothetical protein CH373_00310 [Leptospira perolatii]